MFQQQQQQTKWFLLVVLLLQFSTSVLSFESKWQFDVADRYIQDFRSAVLGLEELALKQDQSQRSSAIRPEDEEKAYADAASYDFIIIGGGTSGSIIAERLSEIPEWKILVLEAGLRETDTTQIPQKWELLENTDYTWGYSTTQQNFSCQGMINNQCSIPNGRVLGGTSATNSMMYTRGNPRDYDLWADEDNKRWCWSDVLPYFKKIENADLKHEFDHGYHSLGGKQHVEYPEYLTPLTETIIGAFKELDVDHVDLNGKYQMGVGKAQLTTDCAKRQSTAQSYLSHTLKRNNVQVVPGSQAHKIILSPHTKDAKAVQFINADGKVQVAKVDKEVILAAGALGTPKVLLQSGIGTKEECDKHSIDVVSDLHVGDNLRTHPTYIGLDFVYEEPEMGTENPNAVDNAQFAIQNNAQADIVNYSKYGKGPLTSPGTEAVAFIKTEASEDHLDYPDVMLQFTNRVYSQLDRIRKRIHPDQYRQIWEPLNGKTGINIGITLMHPKSTGHVTIKDTNPFSLPVVEPNLLCDPHEHDFNTILAGIHAVKKLTETKSFQKLGLKLNPNPVKGCEELEFASEDYWKCTIKYLTVTNGDVSGTCKMGPRSDKKAVVDNKLRVYGVTRLRVADASVIPVDITGDLMAPTMMIGEKAAELIADEWYHKHH